MTILARAGCLLALTLLAGCYADAPSRDLTVVG